MANSRLLNNVLSTLRALKARKRTRRKLAKQCVVDWVAWVCRLLIKLMIGDHQQCLANTRRCVVVAANVWHRAHDCRHWISATQTRGKLGVDTADNQISLILVNIVRSRFKPYERSIDLAISLVHSAAELAVHYASVAFVTPVYPTVVQVEQLMTPMPIRSVRPRKPVTKAAPRRVLPPTVSNVNFDDSWIAPSPLAGPSRRRMEREKGRAAVKADNTAAKLPSLPRAAKSPATPRKPAKAAPLDRRSQVNRTKRAAPEAQSRPSGEDDASSTAVIDEAGGRRTIGSAATREDRRPAPPAPVSTRIRKGDTATANVARRKRPLELTEDVAVKKVKQTHRARVDIGTAKKTT